MAALVTVIGGRYSATYGGSDLGVVDDPGYKLGVTWAMENVENTDAHGAQVIDQIFLGPSNVSLDFISKEYKAGPLNSIQPFDTFAPTGAETFITGVIGRRATDIAGAVVMTSTTGTPAVSTPATATFTYAIIHEGVNTELLFGPRHRKVPVRYRILPNASSGQGAYFTTT